MEEHAILMEDYRTPTKEPGLDRFVSFTDQLATNVLKRTAPKAQKHSKTYAKQFGDQESFEIKQKFMVQLATDLAKYGAPTHRLELLLEGVGGALGMVSSFFVMPGMILVTLRYKNLPFHDYLKVSYGFNFEKLSKANQLCYELVRGTKGIEKAHAELNAIRDISSMSAYANLWIFPLFSFFICLVGFNGSLMESILAGFLGLIVGGLEVLESFYPMSFGNIKEFISSFMSVVISRLIQAHLAKSQIFVNTDTIVFSAIAILLPGLGLTLSIVEISSRNIVCGIIRFFASLFTALLLGFGYSMGDIILGGPSPFVVQSTPALSWSYSLILLPFTSYLVCMLFNASRKQLPIMIAVGFIGFTAATGLSQLYVFSSSTQGPIIIASFLIGLISNIYAKITTDIAIAPVLSGIILLVPGSYGVRSTLGFIAAQSQSGLNVAFQMLVIAMCITIGIFLATLLVWPMNYSRRQHLVAF